jgi:hypothetical protein
MLQISGQVGHVERPSLSMRLAQWSFNAVVQPVSLAIVIFSVIFGGGAWTVAASETSLPGELLYSVKRQKEQLQLSLVRDKETRTSMRLEFASRRIDEIDRVAAQVATEDSAPVEQNAQKKQAVKLALQEFSKEIESINNDLVNTEIESVGEKLKVVSLVDQEVAKYQTILNDKIKIVLTENEIGNAEIEASVQAALEQTQGTKDAVVTALSGSPEESTEVQDLLVTKVGSELERVNVALEDYKALLKQAESKEAALEAQRVEALQKVEDVEATNGIAESSVEIVGEVAVIAVEDIDKTELYNSELNAIDVLVDSGEFVKAVDRIKTLEEDIETGITQLNNFILTLE